MRLETLLPREAVLASLSARDKKQALKAMAKTASQMCSLSEKEIFSVLIEREHLGCTGMGNGVCIPHGRFESLTTLHAVFARLAKPIEFGAADSKPVDLLFMLLTPAAANTQHLKALAIISKLLRDKQVCEKLRATSDAAVLHATLLAHAEDENG